MMHSTYGTYMPAGALPPSYAYDAFADSTYPPTQMAVSQLSRRPSRGSTGQRAGTAMRVTKPTSASNSPRSSGIMARRRTMINDNQTARRHQQAIDYLTATQCIDTTRARTQQPRPVSWHPSTHLQPPQPQYFQQQTTYDTLSTPNVYMDQQDLYSTAPQFSPVMTSYSNNTSPSSTFSPLPLSYGVDAAAYLSTDNWPAVDKSASFFPPLNDGHCLADSNLNGTTHERVSSNALDWNNFIMHGFNNTSPPTPDSFMPTTQQPQPAVSEASFQALDEPEEEGEILLGMGLYDTPDKYEEDPHLNNYRSTVSSLLGSTYRPQEPKGKGLKLEETWEPPKSDDEDEDQESGEDE